MNSRTRYLRNATLNGMVLCLLALPAVSLAQNEKLPEGPGKATTEKVCGSCHGAEIVIGRQETRSTWSAIVDDMVQRGATGTDQEFGQVVDYLATKFGKPAAAPKNNQNQ